MASKPVKREPCPFCGCGESEVMPIFGWFYISCADEACQSIGPQAYSLAWAVRKWNKRK